jgi:hypothetical protein
MGSVRSREGTDHANMRGKVTWECAQCMSNERMRQGLQYVSHIKYNYILFDGVSSGTITW